MSSSDDDDEQDYVIEKYDSDDMSEDMSEVESDTGEEMVQTSTRERRITVPTKFKDYLTI